MFMPIVILVCSAALFCFYCQYAIGRILRRTLGYAYFHALATANRLEFPALRRSLNELNAPMDYAHLRMSVTGDFQVLAYLLKNASNLRQGFTLEERILMLYFRLVLASLAVRHGLRLREKPAILALTAILQHLANVVGARMQDLGTLSNPSFELSF